MKTSPGFLLLVLLLGLTLSMVRAAPSEDSAKRVFDFDHVGEACDLAERTGVPLCICVLDILPKKPQLQGLDSFWKDTLVKLSAHCVVIAADHHTKTNQELFALAYLKMRTEAASKPINFTGIRLMDPWQETLLGEAAISPFYDNAPETARKALPEFKEQVAKLLKSASDWNVKNAPAPAVWTDQTNRPLTATAVGCDGKSGQFKLTNGKTVSLPLPTLSEDSRKRLLQQFPPPVPILDADDAAALEKHVGQEVVVVSRQPKFRDTRVVEKPDNGKPFGFIFSYLSPLAGYRIDEELTAKFGKSHPDGTFQEFKITRMKGVLQKPTDPKSPYQYYIQIENPRQLGPGVPRS